MQHVTYLTGGHDPAQPFSNMAFLADDSTRTFHDYTDGTDLARPYTAEENAAADQRAAQAARDAAAQRLHDELAAGIAQIVAARNAATADQAAAETVRTQAASLATTPGARATAVNAWTPKAVYTAADLTAIKAEIVFLTTTLKAVVEAVGSNAAWRKGVDMNAVITDNALLWLAKETLDDPLADED